MKPIIGIWDQWCVAADKPYVKVVTTEKGEQIEQTSLLDQDVCRRIVVNFGLTKDDLPCTLGHQNTTPEKAQFKVATYGAMAAWFDGQIVEFAAHGDIDRPSEVDLPRADNGQRPENGIYVYRKTVTGLGEAIVTRRAVRKTSPEFVMDGRNQQNEPIGPQALGLAWTDDPFLDGCEINLERFPQMRRYSAGVKKEGAIMAIKKYESEAGVEEKDSPEQKFGKLKSHFGRKAMMEAGVADGDTPDVGMAKFAKHKMENLVECGYCGADVADLNPRTADDSDWARAERQHAPGCEWVKTRAHTRFECDSDKEKAVANKIAHEGPTVKPGAPTMVDPGEPTDKVVGGHAMERDTVRAMAAELQKMRAEQAATQKQLAAYEKAQAALKAESAVDSAWRQGRIVPLPNEGDVAAKARFLRKYERGIKVFEEDLAPIGTHAVAGGLDLRLTSNGLPINFERDGGVVDGSDRPDDQIIARADALIAKNPKMSRRAAVERVAMESPHLRQAYEMQSRRAMLGLG